jgi:hypothetical protein
MVTITKKINLYEYNELEEKAKERAKEKFLEARCEIDNDIFLENAMEIVGNYFQFIDGLEIQYSLSSCQGDGVNIYGKFDLRNVEGFEWLKSEVDSFELAENRRYYYSLKSQTEAETVDEIITEFEYASGNEVADWQVMEIRKMVETVFEKLKKAEKEIENYGYRFFYEVSDEEMKEDSEANGVLYLDDGTAYFD